MKRLIISDRCNSKKVSKFCEKHNLGVNIDQFYVPDFLKNNPNAITEHLYLYKHVDICSIHGPMNELNFGSRDPLIREVTLNRFESAYQISCKLKCKNIIFHNGYVPGTDKSIHWVETAKNFWNKFLSNKDKDFRFFIENFLENDLEILNDVINSVDNKCLLMCFDIGHANIYSQVKLTKWIERIKTNIGFIHMHNNYGLEDEHNGLDNGNIDILDVCDALEQYIPDAVWCLETNEYENSFKWLKENNILKN